MDRLDLRQLEIWVDHWQPRSACVEAGHIYMNELPAKDHLFGAQLGAEVADYLEKQGCVVTRHLFIDNYNPDPREFCLDVPAYLERLRAVGFYPNQISYETALEQPARNLLHALRGLVYKVDDQVFLNGRNILLVKAERPRCNLLDAALYVAKLAVADLAVTVLQKSWRQQQRYVRYVLRALGYQRLPISTICFTKAGANGQRQISVGTERW